MPHFLMPIYTYRREDGSRFDIKQSIHEAPLEFCPDSGQAVVRVVQPVGIVFKGSGFYVNDSKAVKSANGVAKEESKDAEGTAAEGTKESQSETKSSEGTNKAEAKPAQKEASTAAE